MQKKTIVRQNRRGLFQAALRAGGGGWLAACLCLSAGPARAQEALRNSMANEQPRPAQQESAESAPCTIKSGDFRLLVVPSVGIDWNDNVNTAKSNPEQDTILRPLVQFTGSYPLTQRNLLSLNIGVGYDKYVEHGDRSTWYAQSGSGLSFDVGAGDFLFNVHDRFSYSRDSALQPQVAGTAESSAINNVAGALGRWDLGDVNLSLGYDHASVMAPAQAFQSQDHSSEMISSRAGFQVHPRILTGIEATASFTTYSQKVLNNNSAYSLGVYADCQPGSYFQVQPRIGYTIYQFQESSQSVRTADLNSWYADLTLSHDVTEAVSYSLSGGHEVQLGIQSDVIEDWYFRPTVNWNVVKNLSMSTFVSYEHGSQGAGNVAGNLTETYDWSGAGIRLGYAVTKKLAVNLNYRLTLRTSSIANRAYAQNLAGLQFTYPLQ